MSPEAFNHYMIGIPAMDAQHKSIFDLVRVATTMVNTGDTEDLPAVIESIYTETKNHIAYEEKLMRSIDYPFTTHHLQHHLSMLIAANSLITRFRDNALYNVSAKTLARLVLDEFDKKFASHVDHEDRQYANYLSIIRSS